MKKARKRGRSNCFCPTFVPGSVHIYWGPLIWEAWHRTLYPGQPRFRMLQVSPPPCLYAPPHVFGAADQLSLRPTQLTLSRHIRQKTCDLVDGTHMFRELTLFIPLASRFFHGSLFPSWCLMNHGLFKEKDGSKFHDQSTDKNDYSGLGWNLTG